MDTTSGERDLQATEASEAASRLPLHFWIGITLIAIFWTVNWSLSGLRTHWAFFPLWLGYCLTIDGLVFRRKGHSPFTRRPWQYAFLFVISSPGWWLFEALNLRTANWHYAGAEHFSAWSYFLLCSLSFSTVMPAVFGTAEWVATFPWVQRCAQGPVLPMRPTLVWALFAVGWAMLAALLVWPRFCYPFLWMSVYLILDPINVRMKRPTLLASVGRGDWRPVVSLAVGCLICGFFWEMWNYYSYPKWKYHVPFVGFWHIFEMPALGYLGYVPFSWELFALYQCVLGITGLNECVVTLKDLSGRSQETVAGATER